MKNDILSCTYFIGDNLGLDYSTYRHHTGLSNLQLASRILLSSQSPRASIIYSRAHQNRILIFFLTFSVIFVFAQPTGIFCQENVCNDIRLRLRNYCISTEVWIGIIENNHVIFNAQGPYKISTWIYGGPMTEMQIHSFPLIHTSIHHVFDFIRQRNTCESIHSMQIHSIFLLVSYVCGYVTFAPNTVLPILRS